MSKAEKLAKRLAKEIERTGAHDVLMHDALTHLRALDASHRQLLEALENLLKVHECGGGTKFHAGDIARTAIATAKELT